MAKKLTLAEKKELIAAAGKESAAIADQVADPLLASIIDRADDLGKIFRDLKLNDAATYEKLVRIVNEETRKNIAIANIAKRVEALGQAGAKIATGISKLTGAGALAALGSALGKKK